MAKQHTTSSTVETPEEHSVAEAFGFPVDNHSPAATRYRQNRLCPFNNKVPNCTNGKATDPLGTCCIQSDGRMTVTCPVRFREDWLICDHAADFFFPPNAKWTTLTNVRVKDKAGQSAGIIDILLVSYDDQGRVLDFGALQIQAVHISGSGRSPLERYMENPTTTASMDRTAPSNHPKPDYMSSFLTRLAPRLIFTGGFLHEWGKKTAIALDSSLYDSLPRMKEVKREKGDFAWLIYDLKHDAVTERYVMHKIRTVYTRCESSGNPIIRPKQDDLKSFISELQSNLETIAIEY